MYQVESLQFGSPIIVGLTDELGETHQISLFESTYVHYPLSMHQYVTEEEYQAIKQEQAIQEALVFIKKKFLRKDYSSHEIKKSLETRYHGEEAFISLVIERLQGMRLLNDERFASDLIAKELRHMRGWERIKHTLSEKGFSVEEIDDLIPPNLEEVQLENAFTIAQRHVKKHSADSRIKVKQQLFYKLRVAGYPQEMIQTVFQQIFEQENYE